ncbi:TIGR04222 domain-containing membrane protein [Nonomuraea basaltis]|uniref:TIGR04222 domain-containing membrane protein n=1 Tax=Nonomuraea basaltis TaxID=2495887 RepID=UPI00110C6E78|nr:TIGR04222 domain-containing membrane protein [Nonomuraea basaltis]TMR97589.1 TIGR04222 domain-containing membrane protein [Nonomuraea basaltis]
MDLILLIVSVALAALTFTTASAIKREHAAIRAAATGSRRRDLGHYELAYLAAGPGRVADTAIALLADSGDLRVSRGGRVHQVHSGVVSREPIEEAVLGIVASRSGLPVVALRIETTRTLAMAALKRRLTGLGLLHPDDAFAQAGRLSARLRALAVAAYAGVVVAVVSAVVLMILLPLLAMLVLAATGVAAAIVIAGHKRATRVTLTPSGKETLDAARRDNAQGTAEAPVAIALYGLGELRNHDLQVELTGSESRGRRGSRRRAGSDGVYVVGAGGCGGGGSSPDGPSGDSSSSSGPSCGGGGCGGGGG